MKYFFISGMAALISLFPVSANAQDFSDIADVAKKITVRIEGATQGSGVLVKKEGNIYTVLTAWHVIKDARPTEELAIITNDGKEYQRIRGSAEQLGSVDLAKLEFQSQKNYQIVEPKKELNTKSGKNSMWADSRYLQAQFLTGCLDFLKDMSLHQLIFLYQVDINFFTRTKPCQG